MAERARGPRRRKALDEVAWAIVGDALDPRANLAAFQGEAFRRVLELRVVEEARQRGLPVAELAEAVARAVAELTGREEAPAPEQQPPAPEP